MISAVVLARTRKEILPETLSSLSFCDEMLILTNLTLTDFAAQRNRGLAQVKGDWALFVDSDEVVSPGLVAEIKRAVKSDKNGFYLRRQDNFMGRFLHFGETGNVKLLRLARRGGGQWQRAVHEVWNVPGSLGTLKNPLQHYSHPTISQFIESINCLTDIDARQLPREGKNFSYWGVVINPVGKFIQNYFVHFGFLDGLAGFVMAFMMSLQSFIVRVKQYDLSRTI